MKFKSAVQLPAIEMFSREQPEHIVVSYNQDGDIRGLKWRYTSVDQNLRSLVKRRGGTWNYAEQLWEFDAPASAATALKTIVEKHPDWPLIGDPRRSHLSMAGIKIARTRASHEFHACVFPLPLPNLAKQAVAALAATQRLFQIHGGAAGKRLIGLAVGTLDQIDALVDSMMTQGAEVDPRLLARLGFTSSSDVQVTVTGWAVRALLDLANPSHYLAVGDQRYRWEGSFPSAQKISIPFTGEIHTTRQHWPRMKATLDAMHLSWVGDDPSAPFIAGSKFDSTRVPGWSTPAPNGFLLHEYQKEGAEFCASRGMRALIGDEMGVGKTSQAIAAAEGTDAQRIVVVCPANARYVWEREIRGWGAEGAIQHLTSRLDRLDPRARWHITTYDLVAVQAETWSLLDEAEEAAFIRALPPKLRSEFKVGLRGAYPRKVSLDTPLESEPDFPDHTRIVAWTKMMQRLRGELLEQLLASGPMLVVLDEAHKVKNKAAKRTKSIQRLTAGNAKVVMLTGTPLRNNEHEAAVLLGLLDPSIADALTKERGYTVQDVKDCLAHLMLRRTKAEVLPELPAKTRQRVDVDHLDVQAMGEYYRAIDMAAEQYQKALEEDFSEADARKQAQGAIERARTALGLAKIRGGTVADVVLDVVENKSCCVVFCAHHAASDELKSQLEANNTRAAVVDGRMQSEARARVVEQFQRGELDVFIGGINAAGEAITLTRADTVVFAELDWVPAALLQAEDRIHRVGQRNNCHVIQLIAHTNGAENLDALMIDILGSKVARIGSVLNEDTTNIVSGGIQHEVQRRLLGATKCVGLPGCQNTYAVD